MKYLTLFSIYLTLSFTAFANSFTVPVACSILPDSKLLLTTSFKSALKTNHYLSQIQSNQKTSNNNLSWEERRARKFGAIIMPIIAIVFFIIIVVIFKTRKKKPTNEVTYSSFSTDMFKNNAPTETDKTNEAKPQR